MEILNNFGFEPVFFTAQIVNFLILFFIFKRFLYKPILKILKDRANTVAQGLTDAENAKRALEEAEVQKDKIIAAATIEAEKIIKETQNNAQALREEILNNARDEADKIIAFGRESASLELAAVKNQAQAVSVELARKVLDRILAEFFTKEEKERIFSRNVKKITYE
jgi:F-type H+-transporting ATPase subunit b